MSRYIDAEWLKELYKPYADFNGKEYSVPIGAILANIDDAPSIDIVRCRECQHRGICFGKLVQGIELVQLNFCSHGEREGE